MNKETIKKAAEQGAVLQQIQMIVWDYMKTPKLQRKGIDMANEIYNLVEKQVKKEFLNQKAGQHGQEVRQKFSSNEVLGMISDKRRYTGHLNPKSDTYLSTSVSDYVYEINAKKLADFISEMLVKKDNNII